MGSGDGFYWRHETGIKKLESRLRSLLEAGYFSSIIGALTPDKELNKNGKIERRYHINQKGNRRKFCADEKNRIVLEDLRGQVSISEVCRREGITEAVSTINPPCESISDSSDKWAVLDLNQ